jgi:hypothetical protein
MAVVVRCCTSCGFIDPRFQWRTMDEAVSQGALPPNWACPQCAYAEAELIDKDEPEPDMVHSGAVGSHAGGSEPRL